MANMDSGFRRKDVRERIWPHMIRLPVILAVFFLSVRAAFAGTITVLALGDSLMAGYGLEAQQAFPVKLQAALRADE